MHAMQEVKSGRGGFREGAGRKPTGGAVTVPIRVDSRLIPFLNVVRLRGVDDSLLAKIDALMAPINLREELTALYEIKAKNRGREVDKRIKDACASLGFSPDNLNELNEEQKIAVLKYHKDLKK